ncbi:hypothetical protein JVU11DRAFT_5762 [Chiua virens]|nr:hypothetical protein JVU11DRAFT_5762 [Chiua virens]
MIFFFVASSIQWLYPGDTGWRGGAGAFILVVMLSIAWCIWTTRDRCHYWWFQSDPKHVTTEGLDRDEGSSNNVSFGTLGFNHLHQFTSLFSRKSIISQSHSGESHPMQTIETPAVVLDPPNSGSHWQANSHAS